MLNLNVCPHCRTQYGPDVRVCPNDGAPLGEALAPAGDALIGRVLADRYRIISRIGEGGMGRVYLAEHVRMRRMSAIKVMSPSLAPTADAIGRFNREAANASRINHPNVAAIYDFGETSDGVLYLAMEYIEGETLAQLLKKEGPLPLARVGDLTRQVGDALQAAHRLGIVHRDLKPDNILVTRDDDGVERVKVVDFGIAKTAGATGQTVTLSGVSVGTPEYMSPEQLAGDNVDFRSDIYSLGLVVFAMLTNELPFPPVSSKESLITRLTEPPRALAQVAQVAPHGGWPAGLQAALDRAMSPNPADRFTRVEQFSAAVASATGAVVSPSTRRMTPVSPVASIAVDHVLPSAPARRRRGMRIGVGALAATVVLALGIWRYETSTSEPAPAAVPRADSAHMASATTPVVRADSSVQKPAAVAHVDTVARDTASRRANAVVSVKKAPVTPPVAPPVAPTVITAEKTLQQQAMSQAMPRLDTVNPATIANMMGRVGRRAGQHAWLRANGDSGEAPNAAGSLIAAESREISGHLNRAQRAINANQLMRGLPELRTAYEEYMIFAADHPGTRETAAFGDQFRTLADRAVITCTAMRDSTVARGQQGPPCEMIRQVMAMTLGGQADGRIGPATPRPRRQRPVAP